MSASSIRFAWDENSSAEKFQTGVCLHGHTMHSQECLSFLPRYLHHVPGISQIVSYYEHARHVDFARAWWTPPLTPASALYLERKQIAARDLRPIVSLTDHDDIQAGLSLGVTEDSSDVPLSVEWTVPYHRTFFHLGIHNIPRRLAEPWMQVMTGYTASPREESLPAILAEFARDHGVLIVLNHPYWLEEGVTAADHALALDHILRHCLHCFHALELNGTRTWKENRRVVELAEICNRPLISGGDRHACEPSACINLTNATAFSEFAAEIRDGCSSLFFFPHYREPMAQRVLEAARDILAFYPDYPGRERWSNRIFYRDDDGVVRTMSQICGGRAPRLVGGFASLVRFLAGAQFRPALRMVLAQRGEMHP